VPQLCPVGQFETQNYQLKNKVTMEHKNLNTAETAQLGIGVVRCRASLNQEIAEKWELIAQIKSEIVALKKEALLLCDDYQRFEENEEEIIISRRPKKTEKRLIGRIHWKEEFKDEDTGKGIWIERSQVVRVDGVWQ
jgi:hypothetical protein